MQHMHTTERFENGIGWLEIRLNHGVDRPRSITGHWQAWDGQTYHNSGALVELRLDGNTQLDGPGRRELARRVGGVKLDEADSLIEETCLRLLELLEKSGTPE